MIGDEVKKRPVNSTACLFMACLFVCFSFFLPLKLRAQERAAEAYDLLYLGFYQEIGLGDLRSAIKTYSRVADSPLRRSGIAGEALIRKGICLEKLGEEAEAIKCFSRAIADFPESMSIKNKAFAGKLRLGSQSATDYVNEGIRRAERGEYAGAREMFRKALLIEPDNQRILPHMASSCKRLAYLEKSMPRFKEAIRYFEDAVSSEECRTDLSIHLELAECYKKTGAINDAINLWQIYLKKEPDDADRVMAVFELELLYEASDPLPKSRLPQKLQDYLAEGEEHTRKGKYSKALGIYRSAASLFPKSHLPPCRIAFLYWRFMDKPRTAIEYYRQALTTAPNKTAQMARCRQALIYEEIGEMDKAAACADKCLSNDIRLVEDELEREVLRILADKNKRDKIREEQESRKREERWREKRREEEREKREMLERVRKLPKS